MDEFLCKRALLGHPGATREARWCWTHLADDEEAVRRVGQLARNTRSSRGDTSDVRRGAHPQDDGAAVSHQRKAPLGSNVRGRQRFCDSDAECLGRLLLGPSPDNRKIGKLGAPALEEVALAPLGFQQRDPPIAKRRSQRNPRRPPARPYVDYRAGQRGDQLDAAQSIVQQRSPRFAGIADRSQSRCGDDRREPPVEQVSQRCGVAR